MSITIVEAVNAREFHFGDCTMMYGLRGGARANVQVWRRNGATKTWRTRPDEFRIPVKFGLKHYGYITHLNKDNFHTAENCPLVVIKCHQCGNTTLRELQHETDALTYTQRVACRDDEACAIRTNQLIKEGKL